MYQSVMAEEIANLIAVHRTYLAITRVLRNDIVKAANSIGYPSDDAFIMHMNDFKRNDQFIYSEMQNITRSFDALTDKVERLAQEFRSRKVAAGGEVQPLELDRIREGVKQEVDRIMEAALARFAEVAIAKYEATSTGVDVERDAAEPNTAGSSAAGSSTGKAYKKRRSRKN